MGADPVDYVERGGVWGGATSELLGILRSVSALSSRMIPDGAGPIPWYRGDAAPRRADAFGMTIEESPSPFTTRPIFARAMPEAVFVFAADDVRQLIQENRSIRGNDRRSGTGRTRGQSVP